MTDNQNLPPEAWGIIGAIVTAVLGWITRAIEKGKLDKKNRKQVNEAFEEGRQQERLIHKDKNKDGK